MNTQDKDRKFQWLPILLIAWNIIDIVVHVVINLAEPWRIAGNITGIVAALIVLFGVAKPYAWQILSGTAVVVVVLNAIHSILHGWGMAMLVFVGVSLFLLLRWAKVEATASKNGSGRWIDRGWLAPLSALIGTVIVALIGLSVSELTFTSDEQTDSTSNTSLPREANGQSADLLSAFFGLDDNLPLTANRGICDGAGGADGMPVVFSAEIDFDTMQAGDFQITTASGKIGSLACVTLRPAIGEGELRTALLTGDYGSADADPPVSVKIVGNLHSLDQTVNFKGAEVTVTPLEPGPSLVFAEVVPESSWHLGRESDGSWGSSNGCPTSGVAQVVRVAWAGGVTLENGDEPGDSERQLYKVTVEAADGSTREVIPIALGDLDDGDNNHELCLDTVDRPLSVSFPAGILTDPNDDLNPATSVQVTYLP